MLARLNLLGRRHARALPAGEASLHDRQLLLRIGRGLTEGRVSLGEIAEALEVPEPALAAALECLYGVVPVAGPPHRRSRRIRR
jgi:hypothetical protein